MCGVLLGIRRDGFPVRKALLKRYNFQSARGRKGFGFIAIQNGKVVDVERFEGETDAEKAVKGTTSHEILFHHRLPTSTPNYKDMTHPIVVKNKELDSNYYVIHNGVLQNEDALRTKHIELGYEYTTDMKEINIVETKFSKKEVVVESFNDSEAIAIEFARFLDGKSDKIDIVGNAALICIQTDKKDNVTHIHYARNSGSPLVVEDNSSLFFVKSLGPGVTVPINLLHTIDYKTKKESVREAIIGRTSYSQTGYNPPYSGVDYRGNYNQNLLRDGQAGFGYGRDDERGGYVKLSPVQRNDDGKTVFTDEDMPWGNDLPIISVGDEDFDGMYEKYKNTQEYLLDLWQEIEALERDIKKCQEVLSGGVQTLYEGVYSEEYMEECEDMLEEKQKEAKKLEKYLDI